MFLGKLFPYFVLFINVVYILCDSDLTSQEEYGFSTTQWNRQVVTTPTTKPSKKPLAKPTRKPYKKPLAKPVVIISRDDGRLFFLGRLGV